jgi:Xaa-Pro aminopeptidase
MRYYVLLIYLFVTVAASGQSNGFLNADFHKQRREKLREILPPNSVAVFFANPVRNRANDVDYIYHQDPDFFYLTGYREPDALLLVFKEKQTGINGASYNEIIFVRPRDEAREMWTGKRLGSAGVKNNLGFLQSYNNTDFKKYNIDFTKFSSILFYEFQNDVRNNPYDSADLHDLINQFKTRVNYPNSKPGLELQREPQKNNLDMAALDGLMTNLRGIKTPEELDLIRKAVNISCTAQREVMKAIRPGMSEREIQGIHEFVYKKYQAEEVGYPSIVGAGQNGCILHYEENDKPSVASAELILMDLGAEYRGYTADITRTIPVSGKFSPEQKVIYDLVLQSQEAAMKICKEGATFQQLTAATKVAINQGLARLGIISNENDKHSYYPHGCCHHIGLDVHDKGNYDVLKENMVITIEPGIYIPENSKCDRKWWGIAVRIEDDFAVTKNGYDHLSKSAPRKAEDIEALMTQPSALDDFVLPELR